MPLLPIVDREAFSQLNRGRSDHVIDVGVVCGVAPKNFDADRPLLDLVSGAVKRL
jgi:hypothetical protein